MEFKTIDYLSNCELLEKDEEQVQAFRELRVEQSKEESDRDLNKIKILEENLFYSFSRLIVDIASEFNIGGCRAMNFNDLCSIGSYGLYKAIHKGNFDETKGTKLVSYCGNAIRNEIKNEFYFLSMPKRNESKVVALEDTVKIDKDGNKLTYEDVLETPFGPETKCIKMEGSKEVFKLIDEKLTDRNKKILFKYFGAFGYEEKNMQEIADELGISRSNVSKTIERIQKNIKKDYNKEYNGTPEL